jgi:hypothetical protein
MAPMIHGKPLAMNMDMNINVFINFVIDSYVNLNMDVNVFINAKAWTPRLFPFLFFVQKHYE